MKVDVMFPLIGRQLAVDHGYHLFSAISDIIPDLHSYTELGIHPISGQIAGNRLLNITGRSRLVLSVPVEHIRLVLPLAGKTLNIDHNLIRVGIPNICAITPAPRLYSRLVVIKGFVEPDAFLAAARRQMSELNIQGEVSLIEQHHIAGMNLTVHTFHRSGCVSVPFSKAFASLGCNYRINSGITEKVEIVEEAFPDHGQHRFFGRNI